MKDRRSPRMLAASVLTALTLVAMALPIGVPMTLAPSLTVTVPFAITLPMSEQPAITRLPAVMLLSMFERSRTVPLEVTSPLKLPAISTSPAERSVPSKAVPAAR